MKRRWRITRRGFLIGLGVTGGGLALGYTVGKPVVQRRVAGMLNEGASGFGGKPNQAPTVWFEVSPGNQITLHAPKTEMGQGIHTALAQIAAEELGANWEQIRVVQASSARGFGDLTGTSGSTSVSSLYMPLRQAAANLREMLKAEAARLLKVSETELVAQGGRVSSVQQGGSLSYGEIVTQVSEWKLPKKAPALKAKSEFKFIGQSMPRLDFPDKVTGKAVYGYDVRVEGMLYGAVARPPRIGATLKSASAGQAATMPGVQVVIEPGFAGVVAHSRSKARAAVAAMELIWEGGITLNQTDIDRTVTVREGTGTVIQQIGRTKPALVAGKVVQAEYRSPFAAHAHLEPQAALADVQTGGVKVWASTQFPELVKNDVAKAIGVKAETIEVQATFLGGGFGRKGKGDAASEAARLSKGVGKPVHVGWNRSEEFRYGYLRPPTHSLLRASLDPQGNILAFEHHQASGDVAFGFLPQFLEPIFGADFGAWRGCFIPYGVPHRLTTAQRTKIPVPTGWWRGLGLLANTFALESFMDELAAEAKADPLAFRLRHLPKDQTGERLGKVLKAAAQQAGWGQPLPAGHALGIACCIDARTAVAEVAQVSVQDGQIVVHRVTAAIDPGLVINPDGAKAQTEGSIVMGLSSIFHERLTLKDGQIEAANFDQYPLITMKGVPAIEVVLLESGDEPFGMGEPPIGPIGAAVGNAVFALNGKRLREMPFQI